MSGIDLAKPALSANLMRRFFLAVVDHRFLDIEDLDELFPSCHVNCKDCLVFHCALGDSIGAITWLGSFYSGLAVI
jgi:hypothetical protein